MYESDLTAKRKGKSEIALYSVKVFICFFYVYLYARGKLLIKCWGNFNHES